MLKTFLVLIHTAVLLLAATESALAGPLAAGVMAFMATPLGGLVVSIGATLISGAIKSLFGSKQAAPVTGTQLRMRLGGDGPFSFPLGPASTAGTKFYHGVWGHEGGPPNEFVVEAFVASDLPIADWKGFWANDERAEFGTYNNTLGYPILAFRRNGRDHAWIKHYRGVQLTADPYLRDKFGDHPDYPYDEDMVGRGVAYFIVTTRQPGADDRDLVSGPVRVLAELGSILLYDIRKDSTAGGSGSHRWGDHSTYEPSSNLMVQAYNVARGISYNGEWVFGGQNWPAFRLPASSWMAAMNACDLSISLKGGGTEPQFHGGGMVDVSEVDPASLLNDLLKSASAKIAESGGVYKVRVGAPGIPVMHFTDEDVVVTREHGWAPFRGIGETYNTVNWTYTEKQERWANKPGPQFKDSDAIAADRGRTLPMALSLPWIQSNTTGQRLVKAALENSRRFDTHVLHLPPIAWILEALDTVAWTSVQAGYIAKEFELEELSGQSDLVQTVAMRENDPTDYNWSPDGDQRSYAIATLTTIRPTPQTVTSPSVAPVPGELAFDAFWDGPSVVSDVQSVRVTHRLPDNEDTEVSTLVLKPTMLRGAARVPVAAKLRNTTIEVQLEYVPFTGRPMVASAWMPVTIADVRIGPADLSEELSDQRALAMRSVEELLAERSKSIAQIAGTMLDRQVDMQTLRREVTARFEQTTASYLEEITAIAGELGALVDRTETLEAEVDDPTTGLLAVATALDSLRVAVSADLQATADMINALEVKSGDATAGFLLAARVTAGPAGASGAVQLGLRTSVGGAVTWTGIQIVRMATGEGRIYLDADETIVVGKMRDVAGKGYIDWTTGEQRWEI